MFGGFFDMDKPGWRWIGKIPEIVLLSFFWYLCCLPIITIIPSCCALFDAISRNTMLDDKGSFTRFFRTFWRELKQGIPLTLLWLGIFVSALLSDGVVLYISETYPELGFLSIVFRIMMILLIPYLTWLVALQSRYHHSFIGLHINAFRIFFGKLPSTLLLLLITALVLLVTFAHPYTYILFVAAPAVIAIFHCLVVEKVFIVLFPGDYIEGLPVYSPEQRASAQIIADAKREEAAAREEE